MSKNLKPHNQRGIDTGKLVQRAAKAEKAISAGEVFTIDRHGNTKALKLPTEVTSAKKQ